MKRALQWTLLRWITSRISITGIMTMLLTAPAHLPGQTDAAKPRPATLDDAIELATLADEAGMRPEEIQRKIMGKLPEVNPGNIDALLGRTSRIFESKARAALVAGLVEALCATDPAAGCEAGFRHVRKLSEDFSSRAEVNDALKSQIEKGLEAWAAKDSAAALAWAVKASQEKLQGFFDHIPQDFTMVVVATMLRSNPEAGVKELHKLTPAQAATALSRFAWVAKSPDEARLLLAEVAALPAGERKAPLASYAAALYDVGKADEVVRLLKEAAPDDACRAAMVTRAAIWGAVTNDLGSAAPRLKWLREHTPKDFLAANIGHFYAPFAFFEFEEAVAKMRKELEGLNADDGLVAFLETSSAGMNKGRQAFSLACEIKNEAARDKALGTLFGSWGFFRPAEALAALEAEKRISEETKAVLRSKIRK